MQHESGCLNCHSMCVWTVFCWYWWDCSSHTLAGSTWAHAARERLPTLLQHVCINVLCWY
jgi:hypothetical protein